MMRQLKQYIRDVNALLRSNTAKHRWQLFFIYNKLCIKNIIYTKLFKIKTKKSQVMDYIVVYDNFNSFFSMFSEIFMHNIYLSNIKKRNPIIIDCGANIGLATLFFKQQFPEAAITCFEPDPDTFRILQENIHSNNLKNIQLYNCAVSNKKMKSRLYRYGAFRGSPGNTIDDKYINFDRVGEQIVDCIPLSSLNFNKIDILKIDIEGTEGKVIHDLARTGCLRKISIIIMEYHYNEYCKDNKLSDILAALEKNGFRYIINPDSLINDHITVQECLKQKRYVLIVTCFKKEAEIE